MPLPVMFGIDIVAISLLTFGLYFPRHRRKDLVVAFLGINIAVLGVTQALASASVSVGLGLGLFGALSIVRLRSSELDHEEVAYYFAALALGLIGGIEITPMWMTPTLMAAVVAAIFVGDHPSLFGRYRNQTITLDTAFTNEVALTSHLEKLLDAKMRRVTVRRIDLVNDTTLVEVRYERVSTGQSVRGPASSATEFGVGP